MIAIHKSNKGFSPRWIDFCKKNNIPYKEVSCYDSDIIEQLADCKALMWHHQQTDIKDVLTAKRILFALEHAGIQVFPDFRTSWHFDDKVAQKYLLEALNIPYVKSYIFYDKQKAIDFIKSTELPKVFKLKGGAGSVNVQLIRTRQKGVRLVKKMFGKGVSNVDVWSMVYDRWRLFRLRKSKAALRYLLIAVYRLFIKSGYQKFAGREGNYFYLQDFIPNNKFDIRIIIVNNKAIGIKRNVRPNDFRASGSGLVEPLDNDTIGTSINAVNVAFAAYRLLNNQSAAFDFVFNDEHEPLIVEISYGFLAEVYDGCMGYWTDDLTWHYDDNIAKLQDEMVKLVCESVNINIPAGLTNDKR